MTAVGRIGRLRKRGLSEALAKELSLRFDLAVLEHLEQMDRAELRDLSDADARRRTGRAERWVREHQGDNVAAERRAYDAGWRDACNDHLMQQADPTYPIGRGRQGGTPST